MKHYTYATRRPSQGLPEVVCVKEARKLLVHVDHVDVPLAVIPYDCLGPLAVPLVPLEVDAQAAVDLEPQQDLVVDGVPPPGGGGGVALDALQLQLVQAGLEVGGGEGEALGVRLGVGGGLCGPELERVEARDARRVVRRRVRRHQVVVPRRVRRQLPAELLERRLGLARPEVARLLERREGLCDARDG